MMMTGVEGGRALCAARKRESGEAKILICEKNAICYSGRPNCFFSFCASVGAVFATSGGGAYGSFGAETYIVQEEMQQIILKETLALRRAICT